MSYKIKLVGCERYNFGGELYVQGKVYRVGETKGTKMLRSEDEYGRPYFVEYVATPKKKVDVIAQAAAAEAAAAALADAEPEVVDRPDGSEPVEPAQVAADARDDTPEEVDTDDDESLDEDDEENPEEVDAPEDRNDGTAVEV